MEKTIRDRNINEKNYSKFSRCAVNDDGRSVRFRYPCGGSYDVDIMQVLSWFDMPNCFYQHGQACDWPSNREYTIPSWLRIKGVRRVACGHALRIRMNDDTAYDVAWDTVLMACEPCYEWYGGLPTKVYECQRD